MKELLTQTSGQIASTEKEIADRNNDILAAMSQTTEIKTEQQKYETQLEQINVKRAEMTQKVLKNKS